VLSQLPEWPVEFKTLLQNPTTARQFTSHSWVINGLLSFAGIRASGQFIDFQTQMGPPAVVITGRTYHYLQDAELPAHSIHWFLYDEQAQQDNAAVFGVNSSMMQMIMTVIQHINPYIHSLELLQLTPDNMHCNQVVELKDHTATGEIIINPSRTMINNYQPSYSAPKATAFHTIKAL